MKIARLPDYVWISETQFECFIQEVVIYEYLFNKVASAVFMLCERGGSVALAICV